jgi:hypothetical protein
VARKREDEKNSEKLVMQKIHFYSNQQKLSNFHFFSFVFLSANFTSTFTNPVEVDDDISECDSDRQIT